MNASDFRAFFHAVHGTTPFPWQERLARMVSETNEWPRVVDLPTGAGKTACIDIALFHFVVSADAGHAQRARRRVAFVVDRRIIVDEAAARAAKIRDAIINASDGILHDMRRVLESATGTHCIDVRTLRGGTVREKNLVRDPSSVAVILSTVDQIGSRLLFRGYGVSDRAKPMHAGMFGFDTLLLLDEAHIAEPFRQTLEGIVREQQRAAVPSLGSLPLRWMQLSATPSVSADFSLDADDRADPVLARRLSAHKPFRLTKVATRNELVAALGKLVADDLADAPLATEERPRIGVVVNRVATARALAQHLQRKHRDVEVELLIGRTRPLDRERLIERVGPKLKSSVNARPGDKPIVVVATQTIEVGADFDFHSMYVEAASYAAIKQRVGRLNRLGLRNAARGAIVLVEAEADDDVLYGKTIATTWELLNDGAANGSVDLGIDFAPPPRPDTAMNTPDTPELAPALLGLLVQTSPRPAVEPEIASFLHGFDSEQPDIAVVWREGLGDIEIDLDLAREVLDAMPPLSSHEAMSLPLSSFYAWAATWGTGKKPKVVDSGDLDGDFSDAEVDAKSPVRCLRVINDRKGDDTVESVFVRDLRPGDLIVISCKHGGTDAFGFAPESSERVEDLSLMARRVAKRSAVIVWTKTLASSWAANDAEYNRSVDRLAAHLVDVEIDADALYEHLQEWFELWRDVIHPSVAATFDDLRTKAVCECIVIGGVRRGIVMRARKPTAEDLVDDLVGLQRTVDVDLEDHGRGVAEFADRYVHRLGLDADRSRDVHLAARLHDIGKADPRFQAMLGAGPDRVLAKSARFDRRVRIGARHECYSLAVVDQHPELLADAADAELVRFLIGSHHGYGRALQPVVDERGTVFDVEIEGKRWSFHGRATAFEIDSGWADLFVALQRRYGAWGLAFLETIVRLADHRRSEAEIEGVTG